MSGSPFYRRMGLALAAVMAASCSDPNAVTAPESLRQAAGGAAAIRQSEPAPALASIGWQEQARALVGANNLSALAAGRVYAALSVAQYRAVRAVENGNDERANGGHKGKKAEARRGAVGGASVQVLSFFFPSAATALEQRLSNEGGAQPDFTRGVAMGRGVGDAIVERCKSDRFTAPWTGTVPTGEGMWIANGPPAGATFGGVMTYLLTSANQFRPAPPPAFNSPAFNADLDEIFTLTSNRTAEQRAIALGWNYGGGTFTPPGYWNQVTATYVQEKGLNERAATRAFALTSAAMMDALIACWEAKYHYWTMRPSQANSAISLTFGLPNHPSYPSGHSCVSASAATVLTHLFPQHAAELDASVNEAGLSRMYAGIHYRFDITAGQELGEAVARWAIAHRRLLR
jgi:membrane-associated phospholipid phosphatase